MTEEILSYFWKFQKFNHRELQVADGRQLVIYQPGLLNRDSGPDFTEARIRIGVIEWYGNIELHVNTSDWEKHGHQNDKAFRNVILHVVWNHDKEVYTGDYQIPVLELKGLVSQPLLSQAQSLIENINEIPCSNLNKDWNGIHSLEALENATVQRLQRKSQEIDEELQDLAGDWEEAFYRKFSANLGFKVNKDPFLLLARTISHKLLARYSSDLLKVEALLMGTAGYLNLKVSDSYYLSLKKEYDFLKSKHQLTELENPGWKFLRMRPANFPTVRTAQLAAIYSKNQNLFSKVIGAESCVDLQKLLKVESAVYWENHYLFGQTCKQRKTELGNSSIDLIIINTIIPFLFCYGNRTGMPEFKDRALSFLQTIRPEDNKITRKWQKIGLKFSSAFATQGSIELFENSCLKKKCLQCKIGVHSLSEIQI